MLLLLHNNNNHNNNSYYLCLYLHSHPSEQTDRRTPQKKKETGRSNIKTSSLFKHNPEIPEIHRYAACH